MKRYYVKTVKLTNYTHLIVCGYIRFGKNYCFSCILYFQNGDSIRIV